MGRSYIGAGWSEVLQFNNLHDLDAIWGLEAEWFEEPNRRRGGWSGVSRIVLELPEGGEVAVFLKRQENHLRKTWLHPVIGEPTFRSEFRNILALRHAGIPTMEPLYYAERKVSQGWQSILMTRELSGYRPLDAVTDDWHSQGWTAKYPQRRALLREAARVVSNLHAARMVHRALYPKHLFVNIETNAVSLIDLEKMRRVFFRQSAMQRDLDSLNRHAPRWSNTDRLRFLLAYLDEERVTPQVRKGWHMLSQRAQRKS